MCQGFSHFCVILYLAKGLRGTSIDTGHVSKKTRIIPFYSLKVLIMILTTVKLSLITDLSSILNMTIHDQTRQTARHHVWSTTATCIPTATH